VLRHLNIKLFETKVKVVFQKGVKVVFVSKEKKRKLNK
jgi:hypothetical protein